MMNSSLWLCSMYHELATIGRLGSVVSTQSIFVESTQEIYVQPPVAQARNMTVGIVA